MSHLGGDLIEEWYNQPNYRPPVNTHGGLLSFAAPWETPAMYSNTRSSTLLFSNIRLM